MHSGPDLSESDQEGSDVDSVEDLELDIDERSDDEDNCATHEFLRAVLTAIQDPINDPSAVLPYNHQGFAVRQQILIIALTHFFSSLGVWC